MKRHFFVIGILMLCIAAVPTGPQSIVLEWDYPAAELPGTTFYVRHAKDLTLPLTQWPVLATSTNLSVVVTIDVGLHYFTCTASNFWGESDFSNTASVPTPPRASVLKVRRGS